MQRRHVVTAIAARPGAFRPPRHECRYLFQRGRGARRLGGRRVRSRETPRVQSQARHAARRVRTALALASQDGRCAGRNGTPCDRRRCRTCGRGRQRTPDAARLAHRSHREPRHARGCAARALRRRVSSAPVARRLLPVARVAQRLSLRAVALERARTGRGQTRLGPLRRAATRGGRCARPGSAGGGRRTGLARRFRAIPGTRRGGGEGGGAVSPAAAGGFPVAAGCVR